MRSIEFAEEIHPARTAAASPSTLFNPSSA